MKIADERLVQFLAKTDAKQLRIADLYTFKLTNGTILRYTSADFDILICGNLYSHKNAGISRSEMTWETGLSVDDVTIEFNPSEKDLLNTVPLVEAFRNGSFDGAEAKIDIAFYTEGWEGEPLILEKLFVGKVDVDEVGGSYVKTSVKSFTEMLNSNFPTHVYQASCCYALYSAGCGVDRKKFAMSGYVLQNSTKKQIFCNFSKPVGYFTNGVVTFLTGQNVNIKRSVKVHDKGFLVLSTPLQYAPAIGDKFEVVCGCNKTIATCRDKFSNLGNYSGTPFVPKSNTTAKF